MNLETLLRKVKMNNDKIKALENASKELDSKIESEFKKINENVLKIKAKKVSKKKKKLR